MNHFVCFFHRGDRYDSLRICVGDDVVDRLADLKLFMVGCGAIGCEMMKNYALLGIASTDKGKVSTGIKKVHNKYTARLLFSDAE